VQFDGLVRVGRDNDGGYVLPRDLIEKSAALLSLGVNDDWSFEEDMLAANPALRITCVDGTTGMGRILLKTAQNSVDMIGHLFSRQIPKFRRNVSYLSKPFAFWRFFSKHELLPLMVRSSAAAGCVTLPELLERSTRGEADCWVILKSDIEGAEFSVLPASVGHLKQVAAILIEFHDLDRNWEAFVACMSALLPGFHIAHVHGNNFDGYAAGTTVPVTLEMTLVNKALVAGEPPPATQPYPLPGLDMPNSFKRPDLALTFD
jgi:hypothetical protein